MQGEATSHGFPGPAQSDRVLTALGTDRDNLTASDGLKGGNTRSLGSSVSRQKLHHCFGVANMRKTTIGNTVIIVSTEA